MSIANLSKDLLIDIAGNSEGILRLFFHVVKDILSVLDRKMFSITFDESKGALLVLTSA
jgi:hypothetical protein